eukprot:CAMPEP_0172310294 /NCGR_PEP_ID=MMETSP1058-20130122/11406_1 /TAXON_ID=83371 /ORGANISM="Detonula confervacea, Strain CCMP 353" /LENGTH=187 /DNA_ID=CAMNT_0013023087 /DNA_START=90 /DNA_END=653 /DNA_ORIENTATION=-
MKSPASTICIALLAITILPTHSSHAFTHQIDYNDERGEYCYNESFNLGTCLGKQQHEQVDVTEQQILQCTECSGNFNGGETCEELIALNDIENGANNGTKDSINWHDSFCETYNICVEENCPRQCWKEQDAWLQCLVIELDCDWRCEGSSWLASRSVGMMSGAASDGLRSRRASILGGVLLVGSAFA